MISHRRRCICVKVPKCAGTSVLDWLVTHGAGRHSFRPWWYGGLLSERIQGVTRALNLYPDYTTFSFVRNPYERFVSIYLYLRRLAKAQPGDAGAHPADYGTFREFAELCREVLADFGPLWGREARAFLRAHGDREYGPRRIRLRHLGFVSGHACMLAPPAGAVMLGVAAAGPLGYGLLLVVGAVAMGLGRRRPEAVLVPVVAAAIHLAWAAGFFAGAPAGAGRSRRR